MDKFGLPELAIVFLIGVVPLIVWAAGSTRIVADIPDKVREEFKKHMQELGASIFYMVTALLTS